MTADHPTYLAPLLPSLLDALSTQQQEALRQLEGEFEVGPEKLGAIVSRFEEEFKNGLEHAVDGVDDSHLIPMLPTFIHDVPRGDEQGIFLALDLGGTNLRVCEVQLNGDKTFAIKSNKYLLTDELKKGTADKLFEYIADCVKAFLVNLGHDVTSDERLCMGFTFSFPVLQTALDKGKLLNWTKGFKASGAVGNDVVKLLQDALDRIGLHVQCNALVNDTVGTLMARAYQSGSALVGAIFGTGTNGAYVEQLGCVTKLDEHLRVTDPARKMIINTEWGAFDNMRTVLPVTKYDNKVDRESINPRKQAFEKMVSGMYLGELARNVLLDLIDRGLLFSGHSSVQLNSQYGFDTALMSAVDEPGEERRTAKVMEHDMGITNGTQADWVMVERVCEVVGTRGARLSAAAIGTVIRRTGIAEGTHKISIGVDGSVIERYAKFMGRIKEGLKDLFGEQISERIEIELAKDGSGVGAALCALMAKKQEEGQA